MTDTCGILHSLTLRYIIMLVIAVFMAATVGGIAIAANTNVEAETMTLSGSAVKTLSERAASGGQTVAYYTNGSATKSFSGALTQLKLRARAELCRDKPVLNVYVDGVKKGSATVSSTSYADYVLSVSGVSEGSHTLKVGYSNDYYSRETCDRNVFLDYLVLGQPDPATSPAPDGPAPSFDGEPWGPATPDSYNSTSSRGQVSSWDHAEGSSATSTWGGTFHLGEYVGNNAKRVADPAGLSRKVTRLTVDTATATSTSALRMQLEGPSELTSGDEIWMLQEVYLPPGFPTIPAEPDGWLTLSSIYGPPGSGTGPNVLELTTLSGTMRFAWQQNKSPWTFFWQGPKATRGEWHVIARHIKLSPDPAVGYHEIYYAQRGQPLTIQTLSDGSTRKYLATLERNVNWNGNPNSARQSLYCKHPMAGWQGKNSIYGTLKYWRNENITDVRQIDPYYTKAF